MLTKWLSSRESTHQHGKTQEFQVPSPGQEAPVEEETATHSSTLVSKIPWTEEPVG